MNPLNTFEFTCPVKTISGNRALENLPMELESLGAGKPMVITSNDITGRRLIKTFIGAFGDSGMTIGIVDSVAVTSDMRLVERLKKIYLEETYDSLIALGSGIVMDLAKVLNIAVSLKSTDVRKFTGEGAIKSPLSPLVVVPTASATGLETSKFACFDGAVYSSFHLMPNLLVIDPRMVIAKEGGTMAASALAAFGRSLDAYGGQGGNPFVDAYAYASIRFVMEQLPTAVTKTGDKKAGMAVANAVALSGCAFSNVEAGMLHKISHVFHEMFHLHPGIFMGIFLPHILKHYADQGRYNMAKLLFALAGQDLYAATASAERADKTLQVAGQFMKKLYETAGVKLPRTLKDVGIPRYMMDDILEALCRKDDAIADREDYCMLLDHAWEGRSVVPSERKSE